MAENITLKKKKRSIAFFFVILWSQEDNLHLVANVIFYFSTMDAILVNLFRGYMLYPVH